MEKVWQHDWMSKWAIYSPDKVAVGQLDTGEVLTYGELNRNAEKLGLLLYHRFGLRKGDRIAVLDEMTNNLVTLGFCMPEIWIYSGPNQLSVGCRRSQRYIQGCRSGNYFRCRSLPAPDSG